MREEKQDKQIVAYYEAQQSQSTSHLKEVLSETLPQYMIPVHFMKIDKIPITINGKLDKRALPDIDRVDLSNYVALVMRVNALYVKSLKISYMSTK